MPRQSAALACNGGGALGDVTVLLERAHQGDAQASNELFASVYSELNRLARQKLARETAFTDLDAAGLVHEAYLCLVRQPEIPGGNRRMFYAYAAGVMRSVIIDYVRKRGAQKRGRGDIHVTLTDNDPGVELPAPEVEALDAALQQLARIDGRAHQIVEMRYFAGLSIEEIAEVLDTSPATVKRDWQKARAFLYKVLQPGAD
jgi:RNA polymerase sigma factor (TIGR02999 family)